MSWLVTGGAGYIGAHVVAALRQAGERVVVLDDLSTGETQRVEGVPLRVGVVHDAALLDALIGEHAVSGVVHVAAKKRIEESVADPLLYYRENVDGLRAVLEAVTRGGVPSFVFSSSAASTERRTSTSSTRTCPAPRSIPTGAPSSSASGWCGRCRPRRACATPPCGTSTSPAPPAPG